ncbi:MAG TPA: HlyD family secretion protein [Paracoccus sp. (in: a-proteobacteria)]|uniref:HlyD family secretion protein n=1 Tax=Paracoccus sp. TaxID=267 RepID=UPI002CA4AD46|nr:HlyD family secretion protein [Paracoccus sp. (in: a-proteobacteria)]HWL58387.1 HlyD family secretion protein [Paracoccus sp. (in: a-proteobacteria)]
MSSNADSPTEKPRAKSGKAKRVLAILGILVISAAAYEGWHWYSFGRFHESTDDAYLQADLITLQARATGYVSEMLVAPDAAVERDQVIARIDPEDYDLALETAENNLALAQSAQSQLEAQIRSGNAAIAQAEAALAAATATNDGAQKSYNRARELKSSSAGTQAAVDAAEATAKSAAAQVKSAEAALSQAEAELTVLHAKQDSAALDARAARTAVKQAERDLGFTEIRAPFAGVLTERQVEVGSFVTTGSRIGTLVPVQDIYVEANFKETQIAHIHPGASVSVRVDAWPDEVLHGTVESMAAGTGQVFSLLPASNATGNFTKVVQRVPVRITIDAESRTHLPLRPGMSVVAEVDTRTGEDRPLMPAPVKERGRGNVAPPQDALTSSLEQGANAQHSTRTGG